MTKPPSCSVQLWILISSSTLLQPCSSKKFISNKTGRQNLWQLILREAWQLSRERSLTSTLAHPQVLEAISDESRTFSTQSDPSGEIIVSVTWPSVFFFSWLGREGLDARLWIVWSLFGWPAAMPVWLGLPLNSAISIIWLMVKEKTPTGEHRYHGRIALIVLKH